MLETPSGNAGLCHGVSGGVALLLRFQDRAPSKDTEKSIIQNLDWLVDRFDDGAKYGYVDVTPSGLQLHSPGLMSGSAGVGLCLAAAVGCCAPAWQRLLGAI